MKFTPIDPPRRFEVSGRGVKLMLSDCAHIALAPDEQVTFTTESGGEYDVVEWFPIGEALRRLSYPNEARVVDKAQQVLASEFSS